MMQWLQEVQRLRPSVMVKDLALTCLSIMMPRLPRGTMFPQLILEIPKKVSSLVFLAKNTTKYYFNTYLIMK
jgi:hypothetical protein